MVKEAETELVSTRKMLNLCKLLEAGCEKTPDASDINQLPPALKGSPFLQEYMNNLKHMPDAERKTQRGETLLIFLCFTFKEVNYG